MRYGRNKIRYTLTNTNTTQAHTNKVCLASLHFYIIVLISRSPRSDQYARQPPLIQLPMEKSADSQWPEQTTTLTSWSIIVIAIAIISIITSITSIIVILIESNDEPLQGMGERGWGGAR